MIEIAGAGLSGLSAGITLLKGGEKVQIHERQPNVGGRPLEVKAIRNYDINEDVLVFLKKYGIKLNPDKKIRKVAKYSPSLHKTEVYSRRKPVFYTVKCGHGEGSLQNKLLEEFLREGGRINFNFHAKEKDMDIIATGSSSQHAHVVGGVYDNLDYDPHKLYMFYNNDYAHKGYITLMPHKDGLATILMVSFFSDGTDLREKLHRAYKEIRPLKEIVYNAGEIHPIDGHFSFGIPRALNKSGRLIVGERAGFTDFSRAFGVKNAMLSGTLAAMSILNGHDYDTLCQEFLYGDIIEGFKNRIKYHRFTNEHVDKYHRDMGSEIFLDNYSKKRKPKTLDNMLYPLYRLRWSLLKRF